MIPMPRILLFTLMLASFSLSAEPLFGERMSYVVGCVNCHHQTPKEVMPAPPLTIVRAYSFPEFRKLMETGITRDGRDLLAKSSLMGIIATEQLSYLTEEEMTAIYEFLRNDWTAKRGVEEEAKIPVLYKNLKD